jgi:hypothetical protein
MVRAHTYQIPSLKLATHASRIFDPVKSTVTPNIEAMLNVAKPTRIYTGQVLPFPPVSVNSYHVVVLMQQNLQIKLQMLQLLGLLIIAFAR